MQKQEMIIVSSCLLGDPVRYDGSSNEHKIDRAILQKLREWQKDGRVISVCPELLAGFPTPRPPAEIRGAGGEAVLDGKAKVMEKNGNDVSAKFIQGAELVLQLVKKYNIKIAILKARSPSCGSREIHNGYFSGTLRPGMGVTAALLHRAGVQIFDENNLQDIEW